MLEDLLLARRVPVFRKRAGRAVTTHPKLFFFDAGVFQAIRPRGPLDRPEEIAGAALEGLVFQEACAVSAYRGFGYEPYFWRTRGGSEVDLVLYGPRGLLAIEVEHAAVVRDRDLRGLRAFCDDYPIARPMVVYMGDRLEERSGVPIVPVGDFLRDLPAILDPPPG